MVSTLCYTLQGVRGLLYSLPCKVSGAYFMVYLTFCKGLLYGPPCKVSGSTLWSTLHSVRVYFMVYLVRCQGLLYGLPYILLGSTL